MGNFTNNSITDVGRMLLADVQAGAIFTPTRIVIGSGSMTGGTTIQSMTNVITPVKSLVINKKRRTPDGKCVFGGVYTNEEVTEPFYFRDLALYAKAIYLNADGSVKSEGPETLYSYGNAGATADYMPAYSTSTVVEKQMDLVIWVGNDTQVDLTIESGIYITHENFDSHAARHAIGGSDPITPASIGAAPAGFGLGGIAKALSRADLNNIIENGWYSWTIDTVNTPFDSGSMLVVTRGEGSGQDYSFQIAFYDGTYDTVVKIRKRTMGVWGEWKNWSPDAFAPAGFVSGIYTIHSEEEFDNTVAIVFNSMKDNTSRFINVTVQSGSLMGYWTVQINRISALVGSAIAWCYGDTIQKAFFGGVWKPWEDVNPPMYMGVEYRTTERYSGSAVYKMVDTAGNILWRAENETSWHLLSSASYVLPATVV